MADVESGQRFPFISLEKAIGRASELYAADQRAGEMSTAGAFSVWGYSEKSSGGHQTIAALKAYNLLLSPQPGKVQLSKDATLYFRDEREDQRNKLLQSFARHPAMLRSLWNVWGAVPPADTLARSHLKVDRGLSEQSARTVLGIYKENIAFASLKGSDKIPELTLGSDFVKDDPSAVKVGDYVQWTSNGVDQFKPVRKVTKVESEHVWVFGSNTAIPMDQVTVADSPAPAFKPLVVEPSDRDNGPADGMPQIEVLMRGNRLQITADVDAVGLQTLKDMIGKYEEILKLVAPRK